MSSSDNTVLKAEHLEAISQRVGAQLGRSADGTGLRIGIILGDFNGGISTRLMHGALEALEAMGVANEDLTVAWVPGAFEVPLAAKAMAEAGQVDAVITLGAVIRGDTPHFDYVAGECARGITKAQLRTGVPIIFGVLTVDTEEQALVRSLPDQSNKGYEAAQTAVWMARLLTEPGFAR